MLRLAARAVAQPVRAANTATRAFSQHVYSCDVCGDKVDLPASAPLSSDECMSLDAKYGASNYKPLPAVFTKGKGVCVWDPEGRHYFDFLSAYSAVNQGHIHPRILRVFKEQAEQLTLSSRAFYNDRFGNAAQFITQLFGYEKMLPMNTGAEAVETALKVTRKWGYLRKGIPDNRAIVLACHGNFHGRTLGIISFSDDPDARNHYGPYLPGIELVPHGDAAALEAALQKHGGNVAGFLVEPIQGEAGVIMPPDGYLQQVRDLCTKHNCLFIADEIQSGLGRTGDLLAHHHDGVRPDMIILGKALSGGMLPISAILADATVMDVIKPGTHGSTYGGNPLAAAVAIESLKVLVEEKLPENARRIGTKLLADLRDATASMPWVKEVRGRGLFQAIEIDASKLSNGNDALDACILMRNKGLLCKPTHEHTIRLTPPLCITDAQVKHCFDIIVQALHDVASMTKDEIAAQRGQ